jgi:hypothetical protein
VTPQDPPKVLGVALLPDAHGWHKRFESSVFVHIESDGAGAWTSWCGDTCVDVSQSFPGAIAAIERELLAIRAAIPEQKGGEKR